MATPVLRAGLTEAAGPKSNGHRGVEVTTRDVTDGVGHGQHGQTKSQGHAEQSDAHARKCSGQNRASTSAENQPERTEELRSVLFHDFLLCPRGSPIRIGPDRSSSRVDYRGAWRPRRAARESSNPGGLTGTACAAGPAGPGNATVLSIHLPTRAAPSHRRAGPAFRAGLARPIGAARYDRAPPNRWLAHERETNPQPLHRHWR